MVSVCHTVRMRELPVAEVKRAFSEILDAAEQGEQTLVLRHGKPVALIGPAHRHKSRQLPKPRKRGGPLAMLGALAEWETMEHDMAEIVASRQHAQDRPPPDFD
jgi:prevent-host-death family protein